MKTMETRGLFLLSQNRRAGTEVYREILEMASRFGFLSIQEVTYGFDLTEQMARDRLKYLVRVGLLERFESLTMPASFFCLSSFGVQMVAAHHVADEILPFRPWQYNALNQRHDRMLVRIYSALRKVFPHELGGWIGEQRLRQSENLGSLMLDQHDRRVLDGLFLLQIRKEKFLASNKSQTPDDVVIEPWWCGLELELTLKSAERYRKQFKDLTQAVYDVLGSKQKLPLILFLCGTAAIVQAIKKYRLEQRNAYGQCLFVLGLVDEFLNERGEAALARCLGSDERLIAAREMNQIKVTMSPPKIGAAFQGGMSC